MCMKDAIDDLRKELADLKMNFRIRVDDIEQRIHRIETCQADHLVTDVGSIRQSPAPGKAVQEIRKDELETIRLQKSIPSDQTMPMDADFPDPTDNAAPTNSPQSMNKEGGRTGKWMLARLLGFFALLFGPAIDVLEKGMAVYRHYQSQGKAPAFFMTVAGMIILVAGFGYLLQYSFSQFLGPAGKICMGFLAAAGITAAGIQVTRKRPEMDDYGSSLIGLGMILSYLCAYFSGAYYGIVSSLWSFVLLAAITGAAYGLARVFKTRIVSIICLLGGTAAPLLMSPVDVSPQLYLGYVLVLVSAVLDLSWRIRWEPLAHTAMLVSFVVIEAVLDSMPVPGPTPLGLIFLIHLFFYVFIAYCAVCLLKTSSLTKTLAVLISSNLIFYLFVLDQVLGDTVLLGGIYLGNALMFSAFLPVIPRVVAAVKGSGDAVRPLQTVCLLSAGLIAGFGILAETAPDFLGLVWGIEALVLLYLGLRFRIFQVRMEAYVILILALVLSSYHAVVWVGSSLVSSPEVLILEFGFGWMNLMLTWTLLWPCILIMERHGACLLRKEQTWLKGLDEFLSLSLSASFLLTAGCLWGQGMWLFSIVPLFFLIHRSRSKALKLTEVFGLSHYLLLAVPMLVSAGTVNSLYFSEQLPLGKIARLEAFACLLLIAEYYQRWFPESRINRFAQFLRLLFFCLVPVSFLPAVLHHYDSFFPAAVWLSTGINLGLFLWLKYPALLMELKLLVCASSATAIVACGMVEFAGWGGHATLALVLGLCFYGAVLRGWKGLQKNPPGSESFLHVRHQLNTIFVLSVYYLGVCLFIFSYGLSGSATLACTLMTVYFSIAFVASPLFPPLEATGRLLYSLVPALAGILIFVHLMFAVFGFPDLSGTSQEMLRHGLLRYDLFRYGLFSLVVLICFGILAYRPESHFRKTRDSLLGQIRHLWIFHGLACFTYISTLGQWLRKGAGPAISVALVLHATLVLFQTLKPHFRKLISLAVVLFAVAAAKILFWDMSDFVLIQKVTAFILIGILLLGAAYQYQKMRAAE